MISTSRRFLCRLITAVACIALAACKGITGDVDKALNAAFLQWFSKNGGKYHGVSLIETESMGRGVFANRNVKEGDKLIEVPRNLVICSEMVEHSMDSLHQELYRLFRLRSEEELLIAFILTEKSRGIQSVWKPYLDVLPVSVVNLLSFSGDELSMLQDENLQSEVKDFKDRVDRNYFSFLEIVGNSAVINKEVNLNFTSKDTYFWAQAVLDSRGLRFQGKIHLAPFTDMFNYYPHEKSRENLSGDFFLKYHFFDRRGSLIVLADRDHKEGQEVYEDYGDNDDTIYLQYHGFVAEKNPFRCLLVNVRASGELMNNEIAIDILRRLRVRPTTMICVSESSKIPDGVVLLNVVRAMTEDQLIACRNDMDIKVKAQSSVDSALEACSFRSTLSTVNNHLSKGTAPTISSRSQAQNNDQVKLVNATILRIKRDIERSIDRYKNLRLTTIDGDKSMLNTMDSTFLTSSEAYKQHLSIKYRYHRKLLIQKILERYNIDMNYFDSDVSIHSRAFEVPPMEQRVELFNTWYNTHSDGVTKIEAKSHPLFRVSTFATTTIKQEELYLGVPTTIIMDADVAYDDGEFGILLKSLGAKFNYRDKFHELLLYLLHQRFMIGPESKYWPYLLLLPNYDEMDLPLFWTKEETEKRLGPSGIKESVNNYSQRYRTSFDQILSIDLINSFFPKDVLTLEKYLWGVAILDSRSIWWENQRHLVPLLDLINCQNSPDKDPSTSYRIHSTQLSDDRRYAVTNASYALEPGDELFENYGQPNHIYFMYHGFTLEHNAYDCLQINIEMSDDEIKSVEWNKAKEIAKSLGLRNDRRPSYAACLNYPIDGKVWRFLSLKMNTFEKRKSMNMLDQPSVQAANILYSIMSSKQSEYDQFDFSHGHDASTRFIKQEKKLLAGINSGLSELIKNLSFTDDNGMKMNGGEL